jgi:integrase
MRNQFSLSPLQRQDARAALAILAPVGLTLEQAARLALGKKAPTPKATVAELADQFLRSRLAGQCRPSTYEWYEERINIIADHWGERQIDTVTRGEFKTWLEGSSTGNAARAATARAARALWRYALQQDPPMVNQVVTEGLTFKAGANGAEGSMKVLSVAQCRQILTKIEPAYRSAVALMLFAGIRPEEVAGDGKAALLWESVNTKEKILRIPGEISKTGQTRILEGLPEALWAWLSPRKPEQSVAVATRRTTSEHAKAAAGFKIWPQDCLRHTFATYAVALLNEPGRVSLWLGHNGNPTMLYRHYRGLASKADAEKFFALRP